MRILVIIPAYNEELNIERVVDNLVEKFPNYDYVVVNDGSKDNTAAICRNRNYNLIDLPVNLGLTGAVVTGMRYAIKHNYDAAIQFDGDGQHRPEYVAKMAECMEKENADVVIGSRFVEEEKSHSLRMMGSNVISFFIRLTTGYKINDPTSGMRLFRKNVLEKYIYDMNYGPEPDTISHLIKSNFKVKEIQVTMDERVAGESYLNFTRSMKYMIQMCFSIIFIQNFRKKD